MSELQSAYLALLRKVRRDLHDLHCGGEFFADFQLEARLAPLDLVGPDDIWRVVHVVQLSGISA